MDVPNPSNNYFYDRNVLQKSKVERGNPELPKNESTYTDKESRMRLYVLLVGAIPPSSMRVDSF